MFPALLDAHLAGSPDAVFVQVKLKQDSDDVQWQVLARGVESRASGDLKTLTEYFNLHEPLAEMSQQWSQQDARFKLISPYFPGNHLPASRLVCSPGHLDQSKHSSQGSTKDVRSTVSRQ